MQGIATCRDVTYLWVWAVEELTMKYRKVFKDVHQDNNWMNNYIIS
jgi:hypothetical protein